ncbi:response regulator, partial [bacterium]|nr:response regulator [bacterium]
MRLARELSKHNALLCMRNKAKADIIGKILDDMGIERAFTDNMADALREMKQRLPHMIIMDSQLRDGNAGIVHDRLAKEEPFRRIPLVICVEQRSKDALLPLVGKMFEAIFIGEIQPKAFRAKLDEILSTRLIAS